MSVFYSRYLIIAYFAYHKKRTHVSEFLLVSVCESDRELGIHVNSLQCWTLQSPLLATIVFVSTKISTAWLVGRPDTPEHPKVISKLASKSVFRPRPKVKPCIEQTASGPQKKPGAITFGPILRPHPCAKPFALSAIRKGNA